MGKANQLVNIVLCSGRQEISSEGNALSEPKGFPLILATSPVISIITPVLNQKKWIATAIHNVLSQVCEGVEHIIVDGGSTDGTLDILSQFDHLRVISCPGSDSNEAMNEGVKAAKGEIIGFLSSDDVYGQDTLNSVASFFEKSSSDILAAVCRAYIFEKQDDKTVTVFAEIVHHLNTDDIVLEMLFGTPGINSWFFRKDIFAECGLFDTSIDLASDREFLLRLYCRRILPQPIPKASYYYAQHEDSRTVNPNATTSEKILASHINVVARFLAEKENSPAFTALIREWHAYELNRLFRLRLKRLKLADVFCNLIRGFNNDIRWPLRISLARNKCDHLQKVSQNLSEK